MPGDSADTTGEMTTTGIAVVGTYGGGYTEIHVYLPLTAVL